MKKRSVAHIVTAEAMTMGQTVVKQTLPTQRLPQVDPFLLLHHFGPTEVEAGVDPLDVGPHPHRGFEPVTFLYQGGIRHRDSRGNTGYLRGGDVQWMTAGRGIIHSERASAEFLDQGGVMEGIQLWINLPQAHKMAQPRYQDIKSADIPVVAAGTHGATVRVVAGSFAEATGPAQTFTPILALQVSLPADSRVEVPIPTTYQGMVYVLQGQVQLNDNWDYPGETLLALRTDGEGISLSGLAPHSEVLVLAGEPLEEPVAQWGPYVMNTQTELLEAMRDYQMGKMGVYIEE